MTRTAMKLSRLLTDISSRLGAFPSFGYALLYLLLIPVFALLYSCNGEGFYHSTAEYEATTIADGDQLLSALQEQIVQTFVDAHGGQVAQKNGWITDISTLRLSRLEFPADSVSFHVYVIFETVSSPKIVSHWKDRIAFHIRTQTAAQLPGTSSWVDYKQIALPAYAHPMAVPSEILFPKFPGEASSTQWLPISLALSQQFQGLYQGRRGFPSRVTGSFGRMFYLSAVTITTLGYGDIVPISTMARILVALEAILGVVVVGLFLNSLSFERSSREGEKSVITKIRR